jgi:hypothetical protein
MTALRTAALPLRHAAKRKNSLDYQVTFKGTIPRQSAPRRLYPTPSMPQIVKIADRWWRLKVESWQWMVFGEREPPDNGRSVYLRYDLSLPLATVAIG